MMTNQQSIKLVNPPPHLALWHHLQRRFPRRPPLLLGASALHRLTNSPDQERFKTQPISHPWSSSRNPPRHLRRSLQECHEKRQHLPPRTSLSLPQLCRQEFRAHPSPSQTRAHALLQVTRSQTSPQARAHPQPRWTPFQQVVSAKNGRPKCRSPLATPSARHLCFWKGTLPQPPKSSRLRRAIPLANQERP